MMMMIVLAGVVRLVSNFVRRLPKVKVLVFVTDDGTEAGTGPVLFLKDFATSALPAHPRGLVWKYFATVNDYEAHDALLCIAGGRLIAETDRDQPW